MGTLTVTAAGFANLPATAPPGWSSNLVWPGGGSPNGTKQYTINDADWVRIQNWSAAANNAQLVGTNQPPVTITATAVLLALVQNWINGIIAAERQFGTTPAQPPAPVVIS